MKKQMKHNQKGFTLIELIIVIAVMGIIAAVLVPSFTQMTAKSKVSTDIRSVQMIQSQLELYRAEHENKYPNAEGEATDRTGEGAAMSPTADEVIKGLVATNYLEAKKTGEDITGAQAVGLQSTATVVWDETKEDNLALGASADKTSTGKTTNKILKGLEAGTDKDHINASGINADGSVGAAATK